MLDSVWCARCMLASVGNQEAKCGAVRTGSSWAGRPASLAMNSGDATVQAQPDHPPRALTSILS